MIDRFFASRGRTIATTLSAFAVLVASGAGIAACSDDEVSVDQQIQNFCQSYMNSAGFSCCGADKATPAFAARYRFDSVASCYSTLSSQFTSAAGAQKFDTSAASSCLQYVASRECGLQPRLSDRVAEETAGCNRVLTGNRTAGQPCVTQNDCQVGLFCPPTKDNSDPRCAAPPNVANQACNGDQVDSVDHPACDPAANLICLQSGTTNECPVPPCPAFACVPRLPVATDTTNNPEQCSGTECVSGATCKDVSSDPVTAHNFVCQSGGPAAAGGGCRVSEQCGAGLYCDLTKSTAGGGICTAQKASGEPCNPANNSTIFECAGTCGANSVCTSFCGKG